MIQDFIEGYIPCSNRNRIAIICPHCSLEGHKTTRSKSCLKNPHRIPTTTLDFDSNSNSSTFFSNSSNNFNPESEISNAPSTPSSRTSTNTNFSPAQLLNRTRNRLSYRETTRINNINTLYERQVCNY
jgi:hypothetical protein